MTNQPIAALCVTTTKMQRFPNEVQVEERFISLPCFDIDAALSDFVSEVRRHTSKEEAVGYANRMKTLEGGVRMETAKRIVIRDDSVTSIYIHLVEASFLQERLDNLKNELLSMANTMEELDVRTAGSNALDSDAALAKEQRSRARVA